MADINQKSDEKRFNETLKRMLKTPPKPHDQTVKDKSTAPLRRSGIKGAVKRKP